MALLKAGEAARELAVTRARFYDLARRGLVPTIRLGRSVRVDAEQLRRFIRAEAEASVADAQRKR